MSASDKQHCLIENKAYSSNQVILTNKVPTNETNNLVAAVHGDITSEQMEALLQFIQVHKVILNKKEKTTSEARVVKKLWQEFAYYVNSKDYGPVKMAEQWQKVFSDLKKSLRCRNLIKQDGSIEEVTHIEKRLLNLLSEEYKEDTAVTENTENISKKNKYETVIDDSKEVIEGEQEVNEEATYLLMDYECEVPPSRANELSEESNSLRLSATNQKQYEEMVGFVEKHKIILKENPTPSEIVFIRKLWKQFAYRINAKGYGPVKTAQQWRQVFIAWKSVTKYKCRNINLKAVLGSTNDTKMLTDPEERLMTLLSKKHLANIQLEKVEASGNEGKINNLAEFYRKQRPWTIKEQFEELLKFVEKNSRLIKEAQLHPNVLMYRKLWKQFAYCINNKRTGRVRTAEQWRKLLKNWRISNKGRSTKRLTPAQEKLLNLFLKTNVDGVENVILDMSKEENCPSESNLITDNQETRIEEENFCIKSNDLTIGNPETRMEEENRCIRGDILTTEMKEKNSRAVTKKQYQELVIFAEKNPIVWSKNWLLYGLHRANKLWRDLTDRINHYGPKKSVKRWRQIFTRWKNDVSYKYLQIKSGCKKDGEYMTLTDVEEKLLTLLKAHQYFKLKETLNGATEKKTKRPPVTVREYEELLSFLKNGTILEKRKLPGEALNVKQQWQEFAVHMNRVRYGRRKTARKWQFVFRNWEKLVRHMYQDTDYGRKLCKRLSTQADVHERFFILLMLREGHKLQDPLEKQASEAENTENINKEEQSHLIENQIITKKEVTIKHESEPSVDEQEIVVNEEAAAIMDYEYEITPNEISELFTENTENVSDEGQNYLIESQISIKQKITTENQPEAIVEPQKRRKVSQREKEELLYFVEKSDAILEKRSAPLEWGEFADHMDYMGYGTPKTDREWQYVFSRWKSFVKKKYRCIKSQSRENSRGWQKTPTLSDVDKRLLNLLKLYERDTLEVSVKKEKS